MADATHRLALVIQAKNEASKALQDVREDLGGLGAAASDVGGMLQAGMGAFILGTGVLSARHLVQQAMEMGRVAAQAEGVKRGFEAMTPAADDMLAAMKRASKGSISEMGLMEAASRAMIMGVTDDAETMADMVAVAAARAGAVGMTTEEYFTRLVTGIGQLNPLMLRNLGIVFEADAAYSAYAQTLGTTADKLTEAEKRAAALAAIMGDETTQALMAAEAAGMDAQDRFDRLAAAQADLRVELGLTVNELLEASHVLEAQTQALGGVRQALQEDREAREGARSAIDEYLEAIERGLDAGRLSEDQARALRQEVNALALQYGQSSEGTRKLEEATRLLRRELEMQEPAVGAALELWAAYEGAMANVTWRTRDATDALWELALAARGIDAAFAIDPDSGLLPKRLVSVPLVSATERYEIQQRQLDDERRAAEKHGNTMQQLYDEQQAALRSMAESILSPTAVTTADMFRAQTGALGGYVEKWDESARRLQDIANRGAASPWWEVLEIPEEVLAQGEEAVRIWAQETASAVQRGVRPDLIDWEAFDRAAEEFVRDQEAREQTIAMAMARLGGGVAETDVRAMLGVPADTKEEALAVGQAFQQGLGSVDLARAVTDQMHEQMQAQMQRWVAMGSMTVTWFARGLEEGVADDTGLRIAKKLWPMIAPMIDSYLAKGVWN